MSDIRAIPGEEEIARAHARMKGKIHRTPILTSETINRMSGSRLFFKCENFQKVGAFKARGAFNAIYELNDNGYRGAVITHSSGNHGQAVAWAAAEVGLPAFIVMPATSPEVKKKAVKGYGANVTECEPTQLAREETMEAIKKKEQAAFIHPYDDYRVIAGQATCAKELMEDVEDLEAIIAPVGGGGLLSGTILSAGIFRNGIKVFAGEPMGADDAWRSMNSGKIEPSEDPKTIADGLLTSLGEKTFPIIREGVEEIIRVDDEEIIESMRLIWERMKIIVEPSCAVPLAAVFKRPELFEDRKVGVILTGGNVDLDTFFRSLGQG